jgi:hypothetical protein
MCTGSKFESEDLYLKSRVYECLSNACAHEPSEPLYPQCMFQTPCDGTSTWKLYGGTLFGQQNCRSGYPSTWMTSSSNNINNLSVGKVWELDLTGMEFVALDERFVAQYVNSEVIT